MVRVSSCGLTGTEIDRRLYPACGVPVEFLALNPVMSCILEVDRVFWDAVSGRQDVALAANIQVR
jgi:hypothetical protein